MKRTDLEVEHHYKGKFVGRHRFRPSGRTWVFGRSRSADVRLLGDEVSDVHAYVEYHGENWTISDAGSPSGTWLDKNPVVRETIQQPITIIVGGHTLKFTPRAIEKSLFSSEKSWAGEPNKQANRMYHQVVVTKNDRIVKTELLDPKQAFRIEVQGKVETLAAPKSGEPVESQLGSIRVVQRLVKTDVLKAHEGGWKTLLTSSDTRAPFLTALVFMVLVLGIIIAVPKRPDDSLKQIKPDDKYTRMVFDAKLMRKEQKQASEMRKVLMARAPASSNSFHAPVRVKSASSSTKIIKHLKLSQLNALLGKIAKRANKNGPMIAGFGHFADDLNTGPATAVNNIGSLQGIHTKIGRGGGTYKIGGVGTAGLGGGRSVAGLGGLASGGAGSGTVGILDEETQVEGGLDKDVIARVINANLGEIRYCYERQLSANPNLYGKVQVKFAIDAAGLVQDQHIGITTLRNAMVEGCILRRLASWHFPQPKGGTRVLVTYPFMFKAIN